MLNNKIVLLVGFGRGGTNIAWNILQSHPDIVAPPFETGEIFKKSVSLQLLNAVRNYDVYPSARKVVDKILFDFKMKSLVHPDNMYCYDGVPYSAEQMKGTVLCLKSVNNDIYLTDLLLKVYPELYFIGLSRNGYALANGYVRRGKSVKKTGKLYSKISKEMERYSHIIPRFKMVKFEDIVDHPFEMAEELYRFLGMDPVQVEKLRFKSKKILNSKGDHTTNFGRENKKYWVGRDEVEMIIDRNINKKQMGDLTDEQIKVFNQESGSAFDFFEYSMQLES
ncbi:sulfotransferase family protein [Halomonas sp. HK25]|uniref:sulfotransferase family protein n=1 Tax=Halomonas sp. HK25 TaxID=3394321 RepID=UPI0039FC9FFC